MKIRKRYEGEAFQFTDDNWNDPKSWTAWVRSCVRDPVAAQGLNPIGERIVITGRHPWACAPVYGGYYLVRNGMCSADVFRAADFRERYVETD